MRVLAIDPGKQKFGYAVLNPDKSVLTQGIAEVGRVQEICAELIARFAPQMMVIGDRTGSGEFYTLLQKNLNTSGLELVTISEDASSYEGRQRFLRANRKGWRRLFPLGLQSPSRPYDDYVAVILGERFLDSLAPHE